MTSLYVPIEIAEDFNYLVFNDNYVDFYDTDTLLANNSYTYYRNYYNFSRDIFEERSVVPDQDTSLECTEVTLTHEYVYRTDYKDIVVISFILILVFTVLINVLTSIVKKGGVLSGLI